MGQQKKISMMVYSDSHTIDADGILTPIYKNRPIVMTSVRRYYNCLYLIAGLSKAARLLMDFLLEEMDSDNLVYNNSVVRDKFLAFLLDITTRVEGQKEVEYKDGTVKDAFIQLSKSGLLITVKKGIFKVNPEYFFYGDEKDRLGQIMKLELQFNPKITTIKMVKV